jgi:two-component system chemotaxis response regulator CheB
MPVILAQNGDRLQTGKCYLGPPGAHLTVERGGVIKLLADGFYQAHAIDVLFQSLALNAGSRTIGVVVSGMLKDGTVGLRAIKQAGGFALVQAPEEALHKDMPQNAIEFDGNIDFIGTVEAIADEIFRLVGTPAHLDLSSAEPRRLAQDQAENSP